MKITMNTFLAAINEYADYLDKENPAAAGKVSACIEVFNGVHDNSDMESPMHLGFLVGEILGCLNDHHESIETDLEDELKELRDDNSQLNEALEDIGRITNRLI